MLDPPDRQPRFSSFSAETTPLLLSLALLLLAVFIVLVSLSHYEGQKAAPVMGSVARVFSPHSVFSGNIDALPFTGEQGRWLSVTRSFESQVSELLTSHLALAQVSKSRLRDRLHVTLPAGALFAADQPQIHVQGMAFLDRLVAVLSVPSSGVRHHVTFWSGGPITDILKDGDDPLPMQRSLAFARVFMERGADPKTFALGEGLAKEGEITLSFRARVYENE